MEDRDDPDVAGRAGGEQAGGGQGEAAGATLYKLNLTHMFFM